MRPSRVLLLGSAVAALLCAQAHATAPTRPVPTPAFPWWGVNLPGPYDGNDPYSNSYIAGGAPQYQGIQGFNYFNWGGGTYTPDTIVHPNGENFYRYGFSSHRAFDNVVSSSNPNGYLEFTTANAPNSNQSYIADIKSEINYILNTDNAAVELDIHDSGYAGFNSGNTNTAQAFEWSDANGEDSGPPGIYTYISELSLLAGEFAGSAYANMTIGLQNEPVNFNTPACQGYDTTGQCPSNAHGPATAFYNISFPFAINALRNAGYQGWILVPIAGPNGYDKVADMAAGDGTAAQSGASGNELPAYDVQGQQSEGVYPLSDPMNKLLVQGHLYLDPYQSGYSGEPPNVNIGSQRATAAEAYIRAHMCSPFCGLIIDETGGYSITGPLNNGGSLDVTFIQAINALTAHVKANSDVDVGYALFAEDNGSTFPAWDTATFQPLTATYDSSNNTEAPEVAYMELIYGNAAQQTKADNMLRTDAALGSHPVAATSIGATHN